MTGASGHNEEQPENHYSKGRLPEFAEHTNGRRLFRNGGELIQVLAVDALMMGCIDKRSARSFLDYSTKTVDEAMSLMRRFHGHKKALTVERRVRTLALEEVDSVNLFLCSKHCCKNFGYIV